MSMMDIWGDITRPFYTRLLREMTDCHTIRSHCYERGLISSSELEVLQQIAVTRRHNEELLRMLSGGDGESLRTFIEILSKSGRKELAKDLLAAAEVSGYGLEKATVHTVVESKGAVQPTEKAATENSAPFDRWEKVIRPIYLKVRDGLTEDIQDVAAFCFQEGMINHARFRYVRSNLNVGYEERVDCLLSDLHETQNDGYRKFKGFFRTFPAPHRLSNLLTLIEKKELEVYGHCL